MKTTKDRRTHDLVIRVSFNKPCRAVDALAAVKDCIHGEFYPMQIDHSDPDTFRVSSFRRLRGTERSQ